MNVTLVSESFDEAQGGAERCAIALEGALTGRGHEVHRLARDPRRSRISGALALVRDAEGVRAAGRELVVSLCRAPGDVVFPQEGVHVASLVSALKRHAPVVRAAAAALKLLSPRQWAFLAAEGGGGRGAGRKGISGRILLGARRAGEPRRYIALSRRIRDDMIRHWRAPPDEIEVIPNGVDAARFAPPTPEERAAARALVGAPPDAARELVIVFVSNNFELRGLDRLIRAAAIANVTARLVVVGRGASEKPAALAASLGLATRFTGGVPDARPYLRAADIFALPTFYDACSLSTLEALATGLPVVTTSENGASELMSGREGAVLPDGRDVGALAAALARLRDPQRRLACGAAARETALAHPKERSLARVAELIEGAAS